MTENRKTAVYIRLSMEDGNVDGRTKLESDSVTSQRILLKSFVIDQLGVDEADILEYVDDGVSGTHFKRNGFQQLQEDMKSGQIGCVVVKDFSRFGRDYLKKRKNILNIKSHFQIVPAKPGEIFHDYTADLSAFHILLQLLKTIAFEMGAADTVIHIFQDICLIHAKLIDHKRFQQDPLRSHTVTFQFGSAIHIPIFHR